MGRIEARIGSVNAAAKKQIERRATLTQMVNIVPEHHLNKTPENAQDPVVNIAIACGDKFGKILEEVDIHRFARTMFSEN